MRHLILFVGLCGVASAALLGRLGLQVGVSGTSLATWRLAVAALALLAAAAIVRSREPSPSRRATAKLLVAGVFLAMHFATWLASLEFISIARSTLLVSTSPLWAGLAGLAIPKLRPNRSFWLGLPIAAIGTYLITQNGAHGTTSGQELRGDLLALAGGAFVVPYLVLSQEVQVLLGTRRTITWTYTAAAASLMLFQIGTGTVRVPVSPQAWISIVGMAVFAQLLGHGFLNWSLKHFTAVQVATATLFEPVLAGLLAWLLLAEAVTWEQGLGGLILLAGIAIVLRTGSSTIDIG